MYDEDDWLDGYVCTHYVGLMTDLERAGLEALQLEEKAAHAKDERDARSVGAFFYCHLMISAILVNL
jgi:hypothetical protein